MALRRGTITAITVKAGYSRGGATWRNLRATMLDDPGWFEPFLETWTREKLPWASTPAQHSFEEFPPMEAFGDLIAEYARHISQI